ncbi:PRC-barrel [Heracleum sosnowskyi]|uniref:PRC-barrel n=1 Tax=Heracleum sosnowskyi TaxID=360622 RepID=A0AAD8GNV1_9APIA|nr:PRC-barrel [Heracleum sosnowskyi]
MMQLLLLVPTTGIHQSLYSSSGSISPSITITPNKFKFKFKFNYTTTAAVSSSSSSSSCNSNKHQHQPNLLHLDDSETNSGTTSVADEEFQRTSLNLNFDSNSLSLNNDDDDASPRLKTKRQTMNRSSILAKQVITIHSANTLGFVSQLWLHPTSWLVSVVELRPNLLSGQALRFLLHDIHQVGDVVLVQDESVTENEISMVGLETLVGYDVVTPGRKKIGKVRGYNFNVNSGAVVSLELDSFGISIIPSSLVSTYALFVEDVLEVVSDTVIVHEAAASRIQRLTKGFWDAQKAMKSMDEFGGFSDLENPVQPEYSWQRRRSSTSENLQSEVGEIDVDWELPMDYL